MVPPTKFHIKEHVKPWQLSKLFTNIADPSIYYDAKQFIHQFDTLLFNVGNVHFYQSDCYKLRTYANNNHCIIIILEFSASSCCITFVSVHLLELL